MRLEFMIDDRLRSACVRFWATFLILTFCWNLHHVKGQDQGQSSTDLDDVYELGVGLADITGPAADVGMVSNKLKMFDQRNKLNLANIRKDGIWQGRSRYARNSFSIVQPGFHNWKKRQGTHCVHQLRSCHDLDRRQGRSKSATATKV